MSTPEDKQNERGRPGNAQCRLEHLRAQWGFRVLAGAEAKPERIVIDLPGYSARWRRVTGDTYEKED